MIFTGIKKLVAIREVNPNSERIFLVYFLPITVILIDSLFDDIFDDIFFQTSRDEKNIF